MRKKLLVCLTALILVCAVGISLSFAQDVVLTWDNNPVSDNVDLYQVEMDGMVVADVVPNTYSVIYLTDGAHTARVRAHNIWGWSDFSLPLDFVKGTPSAPTGVIIQSVP